jgi:hypothetical protein
MPFYTVTLPVVIQVVVVVTAPDEEAALDAAYLAADRSIYNSTGSIIVMNPRASVTLEWSSTKATIHDDVTCEEGV